MKVPSRDVGRTEKSAVDPNEMQSLVEKFESNRRMPNPHRATTPVSERDTISRPHRPTAPTACSPRQMSALTAKLTQQLLGCEIAGTQWNLAET